MAPLIFPSATTVRLVYGKFIEVWRANEKSLFNAKMKGILLLNASHEGLILLILPADVY